MTSSEAGEWFKERKVNKGGIHFWERNALVRGGVEETLNCCRIELWAREEGVRTMTERRGVKREDGGGWRCTRLLIMHLLFSADARIFLISYINTARFV